MISNMLGRRNSNSLLAYGCELHVTFATLWIVEILCLDLAGRYLTEYMRKCFHNTILRLDLAGCDLTEYMMKCFHRY